VFRSLPVPARPAVRWVRRRSWHLLTLLLAAATVTTFAAYFPNEEDPVALAWAVPATLFVATTVTLALAAGPAPTGKPAWASMLHLAEAMHRYRQDSSALNHQQVTWVLTYLSDHTQRHLLRHLAAHGIHLEVED